MQVTQVFRLIRLDVAVDQVAHVRLVRLDVQLLARVALDSVADVGEKRRLVPQRGDLCVWITSFAQV